MNKLKCTATSLLLVAALAAAGCGGGGSDGGEQAYNPPAPPPVAPPPPPPPPTGAGFTNWFKADVFAQPAAELPVDMDTLVFNFDSNDNPEAFEDLLPLEL